MDPQNAVTLPDLVLAELHTNLLMWVAGHRHLNTVKGLRLAGSRRRPERASRRRDLVAARLAAQFRTFGSTSTPIRQSRS